MSHSLPPEVVGLMEMRELWRKLHQLGEHAAIFELVSDPRVQELQSCDFPPGVPMELQKKLFDFGRDWDRAIAIAGLRNNTRLMEARISLIPSQVVQFQTEVEERLKQPVQWGALLFIESALPLELTHEYWKAQAYFLVMTDQDLEALHLETCPGVASVTETRTI